MEKRRVVFYGRVSTQSDEQLSAFDNQMAWYNQLLTLHPEWEVVGVYEDAGVTGTSVRKRKGFQQMLEDGIQLHQYDLIVTRETKRFARNTVDALSYVRLLKQHGIEIYFVNDGIWTISDNDGELRLSIMATIAQEESRKTSENVKAGQRISRQKGVLRGSGNILGYRRVGRNRYEIDTEQAVIVKKIYKWYLDGDGIRTIKRKLEESGYRTATGKSRWQFQVIDDILKNPFYTGRQRQLMQVSDGYLTQNRVKNSPDRIEYIRGDYEPIISEEVFEEAGRIRNRRYNKMNSKGKKEGASVWCGKYLCGCGCGTVRRIAGGNESIFICHSQHRNGIRGSGVTGETGDTCPLRTVLEWKLDLIACHVIRDVWRNSREDIDRALEIIEECYEEERTWNPAEVHGIREKIDKLERRKRALLDMRADGEITKEEYAARKAGYEQELDQLGALAAEAEVEAETARVVHAGSRERIRGMRQAMEALLDLSGPKLSREVVDGFIWKIVHIADDEFDLYLNMGTEDFGEAGERGEDGKCSEDGERGEDGKCGEEKERGADSGRGEYGLEERVVRYKVFGPAPQREERIKCTRLKDIRLTYEDAVRYRAMSGKRVLKNKWEDLVVHIYAKKGSIHFLPDMVQSNQYPT